MTDLLDKASELIADTRREHLAHTVTYRRGGASVDLPATTGSTQFERADEFGVIHRIESRDFLIAAGDLVLVGTRTLPRPGDRIADTSNGVTHEYEVMAPGGEPAWRYSDPQRRTLRIHTKQVATGSV